ncbi:MAG: PIN domain-containing protein [Pseudomonadota bacterium]|nr:PIN domain-containing protein [Pseudomonadota bacterium]
MLRTKKVFIDTESYVRNHLNFEHPSFSSFKKLCDEEELEHITTTVVCREVERKIEESTKEALDALKTFKRKAQPLNNLDYKDFSSLFSDIDESEAFKKAIGSFQAFISDTSAQIAEAKSIDCEDILDRYFQTQPPFTKDKSNEFRDAISLSALKTHLDGQLAYVVSEDKILKEYCEEDELLVYVETLPKLLDLHSATNERTAKLKAYIQEHQDDLIKQIDEYISDCDVYNYSTWEDAEVDGFTVTDVHLFDTSVLSISDTEATVEVVARVQLNVSVTGPDYNNGTYDKEDGVMYTFGTSTQVVDLDLEYDVSIDIEYEYAGEKVTEMEFAITIPEAIKGIEVEVEENEPDYY